MECLRVLERARMLLLHYLAGKNILIDWENVKFWASRAGYFKKHQIIDGSACILHCSLLKTPQG
jgi:hypothetical protein